MNLNRLTPHALCRKFESSYFKQNVGEISLVNCITVKYVYVMEDH